MTATIREVVDDALSILGEVPGAGVNAYSDDRMRKDTIRAFNMLFKKYFWPQFIDWKQLPLDGVLGVVTSDAFDHVKDFEDFFAVYPDGQNYSLPRLSRNSNPFLISGTSLRFWSSLPITSTHYMKRRLQFWPKASIATVVVGSRIYPRANVATDEQSAWDWDDQMYLDRDLLAHATAFATLASDDLNSNAAQTQKGFMETRYKDITNALSSQKIQISGGYGIPNQWTEQWIG